MAKARKHKQQSEEDALWYKDAIVYELHVKAYRDSDEDGVGDFRGLTEKLDYLQDLGVSALWLLPFCPSPFRDDGYDIADYTGVDPAYGTIRDFKAFLREAHRRGLRVITELVLNHTSDQHPWFQKARRARAGTAARGFYVWSETPDRYREARIIFQDFESSNWSWDGVANAYYWHRFYSHQPDLNYDNPAVHKAMSRVLDFWFGMGVDGLRLDAVPYLYEREGTNCENLEETYAFLRKLRAHVDSRFENRLFLAEANQWPEDAVAYFGEGDLCHMAYHFPLMPRLFMALRMEDRFPVIDILEQTPTIPETCQWALFLRNHDELTLEMVTDEERDYMYRVYAQNPRMRINLGIRRRLAPLLGNNRRRIELMNGLLFSLPGTPILYYGEEIGMGDNVYLCDRNGVRTPMQWSSDRNAGFSRANPQRLYLPIIVDPEYHYETVNVEAQQNNPGSMLWWTKRLISLRKRYKAFGRGDIRFLDPSNRKILAFVRTWGEESILVVANLSRFVQYVELDLADYAGMIPVELFGGTEFPAVGPQPYFLTQGPHSFYWFILRPQADIEPQKDVGTAAEERKLLRVAKRWDEVVGPDLRASLEALLPEYLPGCRWFGGKARAIKWVRIVETIPFPNRGAGTVLTLLQVDYKDDEPEMYALPLTYAAGEPAEVVWKEHPQAVVARLRIRQAAEEGILYDALLAPEFAWTLLDTIGRRRPRKGRDGEVVPSASQTLKGIGQGEEEEWRPRVLGLEQSNTSLVYGRRFILKMIRRLETGLNPDLEIGRFLTRHRFPHIPHVAGALEYAAPRQEPITLAVLQHFVPNEGDAWTYTLDRLNQYFENCMARDHRHETAEIPRAHLLDLIEEEPPTTVAELIGPYLEMAHLLGRRSGELHVALGAETEDPAFRAESFSKLYQRSLFQSMRNLSRQVFLLLRSRLPHLPATVRPLAERVLEQDKEIGGRLRGFAQQRIRGKRIRCHGDFHLGQVLHTGKDFVIIDFEGEPARPLGERRIKRSPLRDVAGMLRSFHYAAYAAILAREEQSQLRPEDAPFLEFWARLWNAWVSAAYLKSYLETAGTEAGLLPSDAKDLRRLLEFHMLEKAVYELGYELNNRPAWVRIPLQGVAGILEVPA